MTVTPASPPIKAIETEYAGCRFRSRLEARWAVFFDTLGIKWRYESQGYELPSGRYLPDFMVTASLLGGNDEIYTEVKGSLDRAELARLVRAAIELPPISGGPWWPQLLVLGEIPRPGKPWVHTRVEVGSGCWGLRSVFFGWHGNDPMLCPIGESVPFKPPWLDDMSDQHAAELCDWLVNSSVAPRLLVDPRVDEAYRVARSARFEFGETPAPPEKEMSTAAMTQARIRRAAKKRGA
jgi:hypothetical protein